MAGNSQEQAGEYEAKLDMGTGSHTLGRAGVEVVSGDCSDNQRAMDFVKWYNGNSAGAV